MAAHCFLSSRYPAYLHIKVSWNEYFDLVLENVSLKIQRMEGKHCRSREAANLLLFMFVFLK